MKSKRLKTLAKGLVLLGIFFGSSFFIGCASQGITLDLDWYVPSLQDKGLVTDSPNVPVVLFDSPQVESFACLGSGDILELKEALRRANIGEGRIKELSRKAYPNDPTLADKTAGEIIRALNRADNELSAVYWRIRRNQGR